MARWGKQTVANLSMLSAEAVDASEAVLEGKGLGVEREPSEFPVKALWVLSG